MQACTHSWGDNPLCIILNPKRCILSTPVSTSIASTRDMLLSRRLMYYSTVMQIALMILRRLLY